MSSMMRNTPFAGLPFTGLTPSITVTEGSVNQGLANCVHVAAAAQMKVGQVIGVIRLAGVLESDASVVGAVFRQADHGARQNCAGLCSQADRNSIAHNRLAVSSTNHACTASNSP